MFNKGMLLGRVGKKDVKQLKNGGEVTILSVATTKKYKDSLGAKQQQTTWHNVSCFNKLSEIASKYVEVADVVYVEGEIQNKKIESGEKMGQWVYSLHANELRFGFGSKKNKDPKKEDAFDYDEEELPF